MSTPISRPRLLRAVATSDAFVPPSAIAKSVIPVIEPPVMETLSASWVAIDPIPSDVRASAPFSIVHLEPSDTIKFPSL